MTNLRHLFEPRWNGLFPDAKPADRWAVFEDLLSAYTHPSRHYHDIRHIQASLDELDRSHGLAENARAVEIAIWFHDAVYDSTRPDNEPRSAEMAKRSLARLGAPSALQERVAELILDTQHSTAPQTPDGQLIVDIDLAGLAAPADVFDRNTRDIRREFAHLTDEQFRLGRGRMLTQFLSRQRIYYTERYFQECESAARQNLRRAVAAMGTPGL